MPTDVAPFSFPGIHVQIDSRPGIDFDDAAALFFERMVDEGFTAYAASKAGAGKPTKG